jgi:DNA-binding transcriptional MerR regulator
MVVELTLEDLAREVAARIQRDNVRQGNGQVSPFPDRRTLRYYTSIGLLDRPLAMRGRQAVYGDRHVLQAVAVKRMQAAGLSLGEIQARLAGLPTPELAQVAEADIGVHGRGERARGQWWTVPAGGQEAIVRMSTGGRSIYPAAPPGGMGTVTSDPPPAATLPVATGPAMTLTAVPLAEATTLLIPADRLLIEADMDAIRRAATPLTDYLAAVGLTCPRPDPKDRS